MPTATAAQVEAPTKSWSLSAEQGAGFDSNVILHNSESPNATDQNGLAFSTKVRGVWRALRREQGQVNVVGDVRNDLYPSQHQADLLRAGVAVLGQTHLRLIDPGLMLGYSHFWLHGENAASVYSARATASRIWDSRLNVDTVMVDVRHVTYEHQDNATGSWYGLGWRHWLMTAPSDSQRRFEFSLNAGTYRARGASETYRSLAPGVGASWRFGPRQQDAGTWDVTGSLGWELRRYDSPAGGSAENQQLWSVDASADRWFKPWLALGAYGGLGKRTSSNDLRNYQRSQAGLRLLASW